MDAHVLRFGPLTAEGGATGSCDTTNEHSYGRVLGACEGWIEKAVGAAAGRFRCGFARGEACVQSICRRLETREGSRNPPCVRDTKNRGGSRSGRSERSLALRAALSHRCARNAAPASASTSMRLSLV